MGEVEDLNFNTFMLEDIKKNKSIKAFAMIVDINNFTPMVSLAEKTGIPTAQFIRDLLLGYVKFVEEQDGIVVSFMGDAFLAILKTAEDVADACIGIAVDIDKINDYFNSEKNFWPISKNGLKVKIGIEYGDISISDIKSNFLGDQKLFIGSTINYASRITGGGKKINNRCLFGPEAFAMGLNKWHNEGPFIFKGKRGEKPYKYYELDLDDIWCNEPGETSLR